MSITVDPRAAHLTQADFEWLRSHEANAVVDEETAGFALFHDEESEAAASMSEERQFLELMQALQPPRRPEDVPQRFRSSAYISIQQVGSLGLATVRGSGTGHGDVLWGAAHYAAELLESSDGLSRLLGGGKSMQDLRILELGAGLGLPSWVGSRRGARVVASDVRDAGRISALATAASLNLLSHASSGGSMRPGEAHVRAHSWGEDCDELVSVFGGFDLVLVCDCLYITDLHPALLDSIGRCLVPDGAALVTFSLHHEHNEAVVLNFFELAKSRGMSVEAFDEKQMPSRCSNLTARRSYVYARVLRKV